MVYWLQTISTMKGILTLLFATGLSVAASAQDNDKTPYLVKSLANDAINNVVVNTSAGGIFVTGQTGESPRIEVYVRDNHGHQLSHDEAQKRLEKNFDMDISVNGHELDATVKNKHEMMVHVGKYLKVSSSAGNVRLELPSQQGFDLNLSAERITDHIISGFKGDWRQKSVNGSINGGGIPVEAHANDNIDVKVD
jgi:hypothetical protein